MQKDKQQAIDKAEENDQVKAGKKAIESAKQIDKKRQDPDKTEKDNDKDAEAWHNEG